MPIAPKEDSTAVRIVGEMEVQVNADVSTRTVFSVRLTLLDPRAIW